MAAIHFCSGKKKVDLQNATLGLVHVQGSRQIAEVLLTMGPMEVVAAFALAAVLLIALNSGSSAWQQKKRDTNVANRPVTCVVA